MEEGALRVDANVSLRRVGEPLSTRTEIKNIGSVRGVAGAIRHEIDRQRTILEGGGRIINETRAWDASAKVTIPMRDKEVVQDYRYMPEPNLPPLRVNLSTKEDAQDVISVPLVKDKIPELPEESRTKLIKQYELKPEAAIQLVNEPILLEYFQNITANKARNPTKVANLLLNDLLTVLNKRNLDLENCPVTEKHLSDLIDFLLQNKINLDVCRATIDELIEDSTLTVQELVKHKGWFLITDETVILNKCKEIIENNPKIVKQYKDGKVKAFYALLGILAKSTDNKLDMSLASKKMEELLKK